MPSLGELIASAITIVGAIFGSFLGVRVAVARLEERLSYTHELSRSNDTAIEDLRNRLRPVENDLERMKADIGTEESGLRGRLHLHDNRLSEHDVQIALLKRS